MPRNRHEDGAAEPGDEDVGPASSARVLSAEASAAGAVDDDAALRPKSFGEFVGQKKIADNLAVYVAAARKRRMVREQLQRNHVQDRRQQPVVLRQANDMHVVPLRLCAYRRR